MQGQKETERRKKTRFPICCELRYKLMERDSIVAQGTGETIDISSGGVFFLTGEALKGSFIELSISWPVLLEENTRIRLVVFGRLVRSDGRTAACTVDKYEFRTQRRTEGPELHLRRDSMLHRWVEDRKAAPLLSTQMHLDERGRHTDSPYSS